MKKTALKEARSERLSYSLTKSKFCSGIHCVKKLHLDKYHQELAAPVDEAKQRIFDQGTEVGKEARKLITFPPDKIVYPYGINDERFSFLSFVSENRQKTCRDYLLNLKFAVVELPDRTDRVQAEAILLLQIKKAYEKRLEMSEDTMRGISPCSGKSGRPDSTPFGRISRYPERDIEFVIIHTGKFKDALPKEVLEVTGYSAATSGDGNALRKAI